MYMQAATVFSPEKFLRGFVQHNSVCRLFTHSCYEETVPVPFKVRAVQQLLPVDNVRRTLNCQWLKEQVIPDGDELKDWYWME